MQWSIVVLNEWKYISRLPLSPAPVQSLPSIYIIFETETLPSPIIGSLPVPSFIIYMCVFIPITVFSLLRLPQVPSFNIIYNIIKTDNTIFPHHRLRPVPFSSYKCTQIYMYKYHMLIHIHRNHTKITIGVCHAFIQFIGWFSRVLMVSFIYIRVNVLHNHIYVFLSSYIYEVQLIEKSINI